MRSTVTAPATTPESSIPDSGDLVCAEIELSADRGIRGPAGATVPGGQRTRLLVRLHGEPVGYVTLPADRGPDTPEAVLAAASAEIRERVTGHLRAEELDVLGPATVRCPNQAVVGGLVSVVVCTRNRADELAGCLAALRELTYPLLDIVIVDNAPVDDSTRRAVAAVAQVDARFRYVVEPRPGLSEARNRGWVEAHGDIVAYTDDDVDVDPDWISGVMRGFGRRADVACVTGLVCSASVSGPAAAYFDARASNWSTRIRPALFDMRPDPGRSALYPYSPGVFGTGANFAFRRDTLSEVGGFDVALGAGTRTRGGEDLDMFVTTLLHGYAIAYEPSSVVWHHHRDDDDALRKQMFGYGAGLTAFMVKHLAARASRGLVLRRLPLGLARMARIPGQTTTALAAAPAAPARPRGALMAEFAGFCAGPYLYARARWTGRSARRR